MSLLLRSLPFNFAGKETKRMAALDLSSCIFYHFARKLPGLIDKDCSATFKFLLPGWNELLHSNMAHFDG